MPYGVTTLDQVAEHKTVLDVACVYCERRGRLHVPQLIAQYGQTLSVGGLRRILAADCPKKQAQTLSGPRGVYLPGLSGNAVGRE
jgi:hypothetical protein